MTFLVFSVVAPNTLDKTKLFCFGFIVEILSFKVLHGLVGGGWVSHYNATMWPPTDQLKLGRVQFS